MTSPNWDILITTIPHRHAKFCRLMAQLDRQLRFYGGERVRVLIFRDNLENSYGNKCQRLLEASQAEYVSFLDDDDEPSGLFVNEILSVLHLRLDYVGFKVRYTEDGVEQPPVTHSLEYQGWENAPGRLTRDIVHFNPIRRSLAMMVPWEGGNGADRRWADRMRELDVVRTQHFIDKEMLHYRHSTIDTFTTAREPMKEMPPRPEFDWAKWI